MWVSEAADWGRPVLLACFTRGRIGVSPCHVASQAASVSMAVETREQTENEVSGRILMDSYACID